MHSARPPIIGLVVQDHLFTANSNWNTTLNGTGTTRVAADPTDILIFSGANIGGTTPATGIYVTITMTNAIGQLKLVSNASVCLQEPVEQVHLP